MNIWFPRTLRDGEDLSTYCSSCTLALSTFNMIVRNNMNMPSLKRVERILKEKNMLDFENKERFSIQSVVNQFLGCLVCKYDDNRKTCYYTIPKITRCINTHNELQFVIRLIEYGNDKIPPMNLIRKSYTKFCEVYGD